MCACCYGHVMLCVQVMDFRDGFVGLCYNPKMVCFFITRGSRLWGQDSVLLLDLRITHMKNSIWSELFLVYVHSHLAVFMNVLHPFVVVFFCCEWVFNLLWSNNCFINTNSTGVHERKLHKECEEDHSDVFWLFGKQGVADGKWGR